jgi:ubiquinol-cytochrome c reductase cytochrome b subunit
MGPNWEPTILGVTIPTVFIPGIVLPAILFGGIALWPFIEARLSGDHAEHHLLQMPWEAPGRLALGSAVMTVFVVLTIAGGNDVLAVLLSVDVEWLTAALRILLFVAPVVVGLLAYRLAVERRHRAERSDPLTDSDAGGHETPATEARP